MATFSVIVNPSLIHNTCYEVMQTATFRTKTYLNNLYYLKLTRLLTLSYVFLFGGKLTTLLCHLFQLGLNEYWCLLPLQLPLYHLRGGGQKMGTRWRDWGSCTKYWWSGASVSQIRVKTGGREKGNKKIRYQERKEWVEKWKSYSRMWIYGAVLGKGAADLAVFTVIWLPLVLISTFSVKKKMVRSMVFFKVNVCVFAWERE